MKILAFDLAWGTTGWCLFDSETETFLGWGTFQPKINGKASGAEAIMLKGLCIFEFVSELIVKHNPELVVYEKADWHQPLREGQIITKKTLKEQARERTVRRALAYAEMALLFACEDVEVLEGKANEVKKAFGAKKKDLIAFYLSQQFPRFMYHHSGNKKTGWLSFEDKLLVSDISDAMALAVVTANKCRQAELICNS